MVHYGIIKGFVLLMMFQIFFSTFPCGFYGIASCFLSVFGHFVHIARCFSMVARVF